MIALALGVLVTAGSAKAQSVGIELSDPVVTQVPTDSPRTEVRIDILGNIPLDCRVSFGASSATVNLTATRTASVPVNLRCNAPFRLSGRATNGALRSTEEAGRPSVRNRLNYFVRWPNMLNWSGDQLGSELSAQGESWANGVATLSAAPTDPQNGIFTVEWEDPRNLLAGTYSETFTVEVELLN
jgi:hypothetical protein